MKIDINKITVKDRIRKEFGGIEELAADIKENGLINPPVVTPDFTLIAGERRLQACKLLERSEIEVRIMEVRDYEHQLKLEISENENRKELTTSERAAYARELERIEAEKARERQKLTQLAGKDESGVFKTSVGEKFPQPKEQGKTRDIVAEAVGFGSGRNYDKAKFIIENAPPEIIAKVDAKEISIHKAYTELKQQDNPQPLQPVDKPQEPAVEISKKTSSQASNVCQFPKKNTQPYSYTPEPHIEAPVLQKMLEDINEAIMRFMVDFETELYTIK